MKKHFFYLLRIITSTQFSATHFTYFRSLLQIVVYPFTALQSFLKPSKHSTVSQYQRLQYQEVSNDKVRALSESCCQGELDPLTPKIFSRSKAGLCFLHTMLLLLEHFPYITLFEFLYSAKKEKKCRTQKVAEQSQILTNEWSHSNFCIPW